MAEQSRVVEVTARPAPFDLYPSATAVVVVDMRNDFASQGGMFDRAGIDITAVRAIVSNVGAVLEAARGAGVLVVSEDGLPTRPR